MREPARNVDEVDLTFAYHLVGDIGVPQPRVVRLDVHRRSFRPCHGRRSDHVWTRTPAFWPLVTVAMLPVLVIWCGLRIRGESVELPILLHAWPPGQDW